MAAIPIAMTPAEGFFSHNVPAWRFLIPKHTETLQLVLKLLSANPQRKYSCKTYLQYG